MQNIWFECFKKHFADMSTLVFCQMYMIVNHIDLLIYPVKDLANWLPGKFYIIYFMIGPDKIKS